MKKLLIIISVMFFYGCNTNPDYQANLELAKKWVQVFENGDIELWKEIMSEDLRDQAPLYGMGEVDYATSQQIAEFYVNSYTDVKFNDPMWLPGIDTGTMTLDGSVRAYGVWTGKSKSTGRTFTLPSYHNFDFADGKIIYTGEYFDATGMVNSVGPVQRNVVVVTLDVKKGNYEKIQTLMDTEAGLKTTRNYDGCTHTEAFFNEENGKYIVIEHWESFEKYNAYSEWRLNEDPSGLVNEMLPLLVGGMNGLSIYSNNTGYGFY